MKTYSCATSLFFVAFLALSTLVMRKQAIGVEPPVATGNDPTGWQGIDFGDSFQTALAKLGGQAFSKAQMSQPQMESELLKELAVRLIRDSKTKNLPARIEDACRNVTRLSKPRTWIVDQKQRITAEMQFVKNDAVHAKASRGRVIDIPLESLDAESRRVAAQYNAAAKVLTAYASSGAKDEHAVSIAGPDDLVVLEADVDGIALTPQLFFTPHFSAVTLSRHYSNDGPTTGFRDYDKLAAKLKKQFGEPTEIVANNDTRRHTWRLNKAVIGLEFSKKGTLLPVFENGMQQARIVYSHDLELRFSEPSDSNTEKSLSPPQPVRQ